jgi:hypothetical protein
MVTAAVPPAEMFGYVTRLRSRAQGRGTFTSRPTGYAPTWGTQARSPTTGSDSAGRAAATTSSWRSSSTPCGLGPLEFDHGSENSRQRSAEFARSRLDAVTLPIVLTGDFNAPAAASPTYDILIDGLTDQSRPIICRCRRSSGSENS